MLAGNVPSFLRHLEAVTVRDAVNVITVCVLPDYLALGTDRDFVFVPLGLDAALEVAGRFGFMLPTRKIVDAIYAASTVRLDPQPLPAGDEMRSTAYLLRNNEIVRAQSDARGAQQGALAKPLGGRLVQQLFDQVELRRELQLRQVVVQVRPLLGWRQAVMDESVELGADAAHGRC